MLRMFLGNMFPVNVVRSNEVYTMRSFKQTLYLKRLTKTDNQSVEHVRKIYLMEHDTPYVWCTYLPKLFKHKFTNDQLSKQMMTFMLHAAVWSGGWVPF